MANASCQRSHSAPNTLARTKYIWILVNPPVKRCTLLPSINYYYLLILKWFSIFIVCCLGPDSMHGRPHEAKPINRGRRTSELQKHLWEFNWELWWWLRVLGWGFSINFYCRFYLCAEPLGNERRVRWAFEHSVRLHGFCSSIFRKKATNACHNDSCQWLRIRKCNNCVDSPPATLRQPHIPPCESP